MPRGARMLGRRRDAPAGGLAASAPGAARLLCARGWAAGLLLALAALLLFSPGASAGVGDECPPIKNKPDDIPHVKYKGVKHRTYCYGPVSVEPGQNYIRLKTTDLFPQRPGYITRFDPELVYPSGKVPRVDVLHLHHAVWLVNGSPQFAVGEEKTILQLPKGFGWRTRPADSWLLNDMLHDLVGRGRNVYIVWRIDFVPDTAPAADRIHEARTRWMDVAGPKIYPVFDALRGMGSDGTYTFPNQTTGADRDLIGPAQKWAIDHPVTLIATAGHLHPGGLKTTLKVNRDGRRRTLFRSNAHYYEPAGAVSWDVSMRATRPDWRVKLRPGDTLSVHATYDVDRADWYEVMGIMPVVVYDGTDAGGVGAFRDIPKRGILTHGHLSENNHHGGKSTDLPDPRLLASFAPPPDPVGIQDYLYEQGDLHAGASGAKPPTVNPGETLTFKNYDGSAPENTFHTITACKAPCNRSTGIAYPIANGPATFDSGQLGFNTSFGAPAADRDTWTTPNDLEPGTYSYFCRVHPFMRGSFRVAKP